MGNGLKLFDKRFVNIVIIFQNEGKSPEVKFKGLLGAQFGIQAGRIFWPFIFEESGKF